MGGSLSGGGPCQGNPLSPLQLRAGGMHPTGMHTSLLCERLGKFKGQVRVFQKCNIPEAAAVYFSIFGGRGIWGEPVWFASKTSF